MSLAKWNMRRPIRDTLRARVNVRATDARARVSLSRIYNAYIFTVIYYIIPRERNIVLTRLLQSAR